MADRRDTFEPVGAIAERIVRKAKAQWGEAQRFYREVVLTDERGPNDPCLIWPFSRFESGYAQIHGYERTRHVCNLVCRAAHGEPPTPAHRSAHSCGRGDQACVTKGHLSWKTPKENEADKITHGTRRRGGNHGTAKLTEDDVRQIRSLSGAMSQREIALAFGIVQGAVSMIISGKYWGHVI